MNDVPWSKPAHADGPSVMQALRVHVDRATTSGFILADFSFLPVYANDVAFQIVERMIGPRAASGWETSVQQELQRIFKAASYPGSSSPVSFVSGRRRYTCRSCVLDVRAEPRPPLVVLMMERHIVAAAGLLEASRRYRLSPRECETVLYLSHGLTTKEIA